MSDKMETIRARHSVRQYLQKQIPEGIRKELDDYTAELNRQSSLHIQILYEEPECLALENTGSRCSPLA